MSYLANGRRRPGPRPSLTREDIVRAALDTRPSPGGDTPGRHTPGGDTDLSTLTMPALAARLGVSHSTLYRYVASRDDLMIAVVDHAMRCWTWPAAEGPWRRLLERFSDSLWEFVHHFPGIARVIWEMVVIPPAMLELARSYIEALHRDGLSRADCLLAYDFVADITVPSNATLGVHLVTATCGDVEQFINVNVLAETVNNVDNGTLPRTGSDTMPLVAIGAAALVLGGAFLYGARRPRNA